MNFSWVIPDKLAGSMGPVNREQLLYLKEQGVGAVLRMEPHTVSAAEAGMVDMAEYVVDFAAPTLDQVDRMISFIGVQLAGSVRVAVSCRAGVGRTGTVLACYLVHTGYGLIKRALAASAANGLDAQLDLERDLQRHAAMTDDNAEGVAAFREKRAPHFKGF